jgi:hypothetical protein
VDRECASIPQNRALPYIELNRDETPRLIEVKATGHGKHFPFYVSPNEVAVSEREAAAYHLYRLFSIARQPRLYMLQGALSATCRLEPSQFSARGGGQG